jgi:hypothetical protein
MQTLLVWKVLFTSDLRISSSFFYIFSNFFYFFKEFKIVNSKTGIFKFRLSRIHRISENSTAFVNPGPCGCAYFSLANCKTGRFLILILKMVYFLGLCKIGPFFTGHPFVGF